MEDNKNKSDDLDELARDLTLSSSGSETQSNTESSDTYTDTDTEGSYSTKATTEPLYISEGRLINGTEDLFKLPTPLELLGDKFFESFTVKPDDFDETRAVYFNAGF
jgi:hypothetical protein